MQLTAAQVLITNGSQQGLDLAAKALIDADARVLVETPTYLGAVQAFTPYEPALEGVASDGEGPLPEALAAAAAGARFAYLLPNFQNPRGHVYSETRRAALVDAARAANLALVEDNPYGDLWYEAPPPKGLASRWHEGVLYLGSFSKVLAPGLRLGYMVAPPALYPKLLQAKQAADLHTAIFNQRIVHEVLKSGMLDTHVASIRERYRRHRDAMAAALDRHMTGLATWTRPVGGMFFWLDLAGGLDAMALLPRAVDAGVAYVPGAPFYAQAGRADTLRLSFVTVPPEKIEAGVAALAGVLRQAAAGVR
jgi:2-aminoadipate transaminase